MSGLRCDRAGVGRRHPPGRPAAPRGRANGWGGVRYRIYLTRSWSPVSTSPS